MASPQTPHRTARPQHAPAGAEFGLYQIVRDYDEVELSSGLYVFPDTVDFFIWHICIFVNAGPYSSGVFRAVLTVHPHYPAAGARPLFVFVDKPLHPLVDAATGALQLEARFPAWTAEVRESPSASRRACLMLPLLISGPADARRQPGARGAEPFGGDPPAAASPPAGRRSCHAPVPRGRAGVSPPGEA